MSQRSPRHFITLTTDFGAASSYVAQMKGVILSRNPEARVVDLTHSIASQDIRGAAIVLADACPRFPPGTIHLAVVDPGVGTDRRIVFAQIGEQQFIAPDNGLLTLLVEGSPPTLLINVTNTLYFLPTVSRTFHGRDILAPVAAHLSLGLSPKKLGEPLASLVALPFPRPVVRHNEIAGQVIHIDSFGNLITNITTTELTGCSTTGNANLADPSTPTVECKSATTTGVVDTYGCRPTGSLIAVMGSSGRLELAIVNGNAAATLSANLDEPVVVRF
jgi:S-adenosylmethionine hydrolase